MSLPSNVSTGTITGKFIVAVADGADSGYDPDGYPAQGTITFTPSVPYLPDPTADEPVTILAAPITGILDSGGYLCTPEVSNPTKPGRRGLNLIATDDPDLSVTGWTWRVEYKLSPINKVPVPQIPSHSILVPSGGTIDLTTAVQVPSSPGVGIDQVTIIAGQAFASAADAAGSAAAAQALATDAANSATASADAATAAQTTAIDLEADANNPASPWWAAFFNYIKGLFVRKGEIVVDIKDYGAVGDGLTSNPTDNTAAIQRAVDAIAIGQATSNELYISDGDFWTKGAVVLPNGVPMTITGPGKLVKNGASTSYAVFAGLSKGATGYGSGPSNITMHGLTFQGTFGTNKRTLCAMALHHSENILAYNNTFIACSGGGHRFDLQGCRNVIIRDNVFKGFDTSYNELYSEDIQLDFSARGGASYPETILTSYDTLPTRDVLVENNKWLPLTIDGTTYPAGNPVGNHGTMVGQYIDNVTIRGNYIENPVNDTGTFVPGTMHFIAVKNLLIENNTITGNSNTNPAIKVYKGISGGTLETAQQENSTNVAISPAQVFADVTIRGNKISGYTGGTDCVRLEGDSATNRATNATVENNTLTNNSPDNGATNTGPLTVNITFVETVSYRGNKVKGSRRVCTITNCTNVTVAQNSGVNIGANDITLDTCTQAVITGNTLTNAKAYSIWATNCTDVSITANSVEGRTYDAAGPLIRCSNPVRAVVTGNTLKGLAGTSNKGIEFSGTFTSSLITGNIAVGFTTPISPAATATGATVGTNITA